MRKKLSIFLFLFVPSISLGDNAVFNSGFDMSPWDSGWTIETDTSSKWDVTLVIAEVKPDSGKSLPNCCYLKTYSQIDAPGGGGAGEAKAKTMITQNFEGITDCEIKAYVKWNWFPGFKSGGGYNKSYAMMEGYINNEWKLIWEASIGDNQNWTEVSTTLVDDTLSGIRFCTESSFYLTCHCGLGWSHSYLWVDDIYVGEVGIEESEKLRVKSEKLKIWPNPFTEYTAIKSSSYQAINGKVQVYDMMGRLVEETNVGLEDCKIGEKLLPGVYFVKVRGYKPAKIIKLMEVL